MAGPTGRKRQSCEKFKNFFWKILKQGQKYILGATVLAKNCQIWKIEEVFYRWC